MKTFYNDIDVYCTRWLKNLVLTGEISHGDVSGVSIVDLEAWSLMQYRRVHLCAGIGGWDLALQLAGWPAALPVWTASFPCQPFSAAGKQEGEKDVRHIWPVGLELIKQCRPRICFGEQVASKLGREWLSGVRSDLEALGYAVGAADLCSPGVGAPHIRQRLYWVAYANGERRNRIDSLLRPEDGRPILENSLLETTRGGAVSGLADTERDAGRPGRIADESGSSNAEARTGAPVELGRCGDVGRVEHTASQQEGLPGQSRQSRGCCELDGLGDPNNEGSQGRFSGGDSAGQLSARSSGMGNFWGEYDIVNCLDGKTRRIEPGTFPLATRVPARVGKLRAYGNAIVPQVAATFIKSVMEVLFV